MSNHGDGNSRGDSHTSAAHRSHNAETTAELERLRARVRELERQDASCHQAMSCGDPNCQPLLQQVINALPVRVFWKDLDFRYLGCNRSFAEDAGLSSPGEILGKHDFELAWKDCASIYRADDVAVVEREEFRSNYEERQVHRGGRELWIRTSKRPLYGAEGAIIGVFGCYEEITEQRAAEQVRVANEAQFRTHFQEAADGIFVTDASGDYIRVNPAASKLVGYSEAELLTMNAADLLPKYELEAMPLRIEKIQRGRRFDSQRRLVRKDGTTFTAELSVTRLHDGNIHAIVRDISDREREARERQDLERQLHHAQRLETVGRLAGGVAHDFNNLLMVISSSVYLLEINTKRADENAGCGEVTELLDGISRACDRAQGLTSQLLAFSRRQPQNTILIDLCALVRRARPLAARLLGEQATLSLVLPDESLFVRADEQQLEQVLLNLVSNAADAMPEGGRVSIAVSFCDRFDHSWARLRVEDTGTGIDAEHLPAIFEPFFTTKPPGQGTGLGLATVYGIVSQSGGAVEVDSEPGVGTTFEILLPIAADTEAGPSEREIPEYHESPKNVAHRNGLILVVDDDTSVRRSVRRLLEQAGHRVLTASRAAKALEIVKTSTERPSIVISDVVMPGMNGFSLAERLTELLPKARILLLSGYSDQLLADGVTLTDRCEVKAKPFVAQALLDWVANALDR